MHKMSLEKENSFSRLHKPIGREPRFSAFRFDSFRFCRAIKCLFRVFVFKNGLVGQACYCRSDDRGDPEEPELLQCPALNE